MNSLIPLLGNSRVRVKRVPPCSMLSSAKLFNFASIADGSSNKTSTGKIGNVSLQGQTAWVVGGVGVTGRGICYGLLKAGATVIVNSSSERRLMQMQQDLNHPKRLIGLVGTMRPKGAHDLVDKAISALNSTGFELNHVVAHSGVRWWAGNNGQMHETLFSDALLNSNEHGMWECGAKEFGVLPELHYAAARLLIPRMPAVENSTYTFVTGGEGENRSILSQVNTHAVWGLSAALREQYKEATLRIIELRVNLRINRPARERAFDPRARPLSADIGELCAGMASTTTSNSLLPARGFYSLNKTGDILEKKMMYPCPEVEDDIPMLWHFDKR